MDNNNNAPTTVSMSKVAEVCSRHQTRYDFSCCLKPNLAVKSINIGGNNVNQTNTNMSF